MYLNLNCRSFSFSKWTPLLDLLFQTLYSEYKGKFSKKYIIEDKVLNRVWKLPSLDKIKFYIAKVLPSYMVSQKLHLIVLKMKQNTDSDGESNVEDQNFKVGRY